jgi:hypothetical protein
MTLPKGGPVIVASSFPGSRMRPIAAGQDRSPFFFFGRFFSMLAAGLTSRLILSSSIPHVIIWRSTVSMVRAASLPPRGRSRAPSPRGLFTMTFFMASRTCSRAN